MNLPQARKTLVKIEIWARGHAECAPDSEYDDESCLRSAIASGDDAEVREVLRDVTDTDRSDIGHEHYMIVSDGGTPLWQGWLDASRAGKPAPAEAAPQETAGDEPCAVPDDGGVLNVVRPSEVLVAALGPAIDAGQAAEIGRQLGEQNDAPVIVVTDVAAVKTWPRDVAAERDRYGTALDEIDPAKLDELAGWFDDDDKLKMWLYEQRPDVFPSAWEKRGTDVQSDLRRWAGLLRAARAGLEPCGTLRGKLREYAVNLETAAARCYAEAGRTPSPAREVLQIQARILTGFAAEFRDLAQMPAGDAETAQDGSERPGSGDETPDGRLLALRGAVAARDAEIVVLRKQLADAREQVALRDRQRADQYARELNDGNPVRFAADPLPGGWVCAAMDLTNPSGICGAPVESEPCPEHRDPEWSPE